MFYLKAHLELNTLSSIILLSSPEWILMNILIYSEHKDK